MTCIVGLEKDGVVYIGGDSAGVSGYDVSIIEQPKVFRIGEMLIGYTSSFRMGQIIQYNFEVPENTMSDDLQYLVCKFIPALRECFKLNGYAKIENNTEEGGTFLLGYRGKLYKVEDNYLVLRNTDGYNACGCGESYALGAMFAASRTMRADQAVEYCLVVSAHFSAGVRPPFHIMAQGMG
jgi:ATP-dependent protease HslVU (ClpYQ) peptidase subunit